MSMTQQMSKLSKCNIKKDIKTKEFWHVKYNTVRIKYHSIYVTLMYNSLAKNEHELTEQMSKTSQMSLNEQNLTK